MGLDSFSRSFMYTTIYTLYSYILCSYLKTDMSQQIQTEIRRAQTPDKYSITFCFPSKFAKISEIQKGDFLKCHIEDNKLVVEKAIL